MIRVLAASVLLAATMGLSGRLSELGGEAGARLISVPEARDSRGATRAEASDTSARSLSRSLAHFGVPGTWFTRHAADSDKARILRLRIRHAADVESFFSSHKKLAETTLGRASRWQHRRMGRWARRALAEILNPHTRPWWMSRLAWATGICETGKGNRYPDFRHDSGTYEGFSGWWYGTWDADKPAGFPDHAWQATPEQQYRVFLIGRSRGRHWGCIAHGGYRGWM